MAKNKSVPQRFLEYLKQTYECVKCTESCEYCLDFHHIDSTKKRATLATITGCTPEFLIDEVRRCAIVCSNCHRKIHAGVLSITKRDALRLRPADYLKLEQTFGGKRATRVSKLKPPRDELALLIKQHNIYHIAKLYNTDKAKVENWIISDNLYE